MKTSRIVDPNQLLAGRVEPGFVSAYLEKEHLARYHWASRLVRGKSVLDVACGTGYGSKMLLEAGARQVVSVDLSRPALAFGAERYPGPGYLQADALDLPFKHGAFDVVISLETIEHLVDPMRFLQGVRAVLREDGQLVLSTPNRSMSDGSNPYHIHEMTLAELLEMLEKNGFQVIRLLGQHWALRQRKGLWRLKGLGRLAYEIGRRPWIWKPPASLRLEPYNWYLLIRPKSVARQ
jgi:2-polyprenyl-3-methyl-5-hydroxy-6-metoxy-1,4-benzoquinol methylase